MKTNWIGVLDCNNFFVSCERLFRPDLKTKPVVVLSSNDGCIVARSQEIKDKGIPMGVPYFQVKDTLKDIGATCFSSNLTLYRDISRRVFEVMKEEISQVDEYSIDEAFFLLENLSETEAETQARMIKDKVERVVGIPVSLGLGPSKTIAKYANDRAKKTTGVCTYTSSVWQRDSQQIPLGAIWGVGGKTELRFKSHGLSTVADFLAVDLSRVKQLFGVNGTRLQTELSGSEQPFVIEKTIQKSMVSSRSFKAATTDKTVLQDAVSHHVTEVARDLRLISQKAVCITVFIRPNRHSDFLLQGASAELILATPSNDSFALVQAAQKLLNRMYKEDIPYQKVGVAVGGFIPETIQQLDLFTHPKPGSQQLMKTIDTLQKKFGNHSVILGSRLQGSKWKAKAELRSPSYTTQWNDIKEVQTEVRVK